MEMDAMVTEQPIESRTENIRSELYDSQIRDFLRLLDEDRDLAYRRYGFTMFYSLPDDRLTRERLDLGWPAVTAIDLYNNGCLANSQERHKEAAEFYVKALEQGCPLPEAHYNLALTYEQLGRAADAKQAYRDYLDSLTAKGNLSDEEQQDKQAVEAHLGTL